MRVNGPQGVATKPPAASLDSMINKVQTSKKLTFADTRAICQQLLSRGPLTSADLNKAVGLFKGIEDTAQSPVKVEQKGVGSADHNGSMSTYALYSGMPRDLAGFAGSGQTFQQSLSPKDDLAMKVTGKASKDYTLTFKILDQPLSVKIPKGSSADGTAALIAKTINAAKQQVANSYGADGNWTFGYASDATPHGANALAKGPSIALDPDIYD